jgi:hypothetical protein
MVNVFVLVVFVYGHTTVIDENFTKETCEKARQTIFQEFDRTTPWRVVPKPVTVCIERTRQ